MQESQCTVGDVLEKLTDEAAALNVLQRISYTKWLSRLRYDLETSLNFVVWWETAGKSRCIKCAPHLKAAVIDARN